MAVMLRQDARVFEFGPFRLDTVEKLFFKNGELVALAPKAFELLAILVKQSGHLVDKTDLLKEIWPDSYVEESSLTQNIYVLRKILSDGNSEQRYIETVPRRGYRFVADVHPVGLSAIGTQAMASEDEPPAVPHLFIVAKQEPAQE